MKDLDSLPERMSTLSEKKINGSEVESQRDAVEDKIFDFPPSSINQSHHVSSSRFRARPKLASAHAVLSSKLEEPTETLTNYYEEAKPEPLESVEALQKPQEMTKDEDAEERRVNERVTADGTFGGKASKATFNAATRKSLWRGKIEPKERPKEGMRERLKGSFESIDESSEGDFGSRRMQRKKSWGSKQRKTQTFGSRDGENYMVGSMEKDIEKEMVPHPVLSRVLFHSSASSSSSFNNSSAESDEVFSESEETAARRQTMKKVSEILGKLYPKPLIRIPQYLSRPVKLVLRSV